MPWQDIKQLPALPGIKHAFQGTLNNPVQRKVVRPGVLNPLAGLFYDFQLLGNPGDISRISGTNQVGYDIWKAINGGNPPSMPILEWGRTLWPNLNGIMPSGPLVQTCNQFDWNWPTTWFAPPEISGAGWITIYWDPAVKDHYPYQIMCISEENIPKTHCSIKIELYDKDKSTVLKWWQLECDATCLIHYEVGRAFDGAVYYSGWAGAFGPTEGAHQFGSGRVENIKITHDDNGPIQTFYFTRFTLDPYNDSNQQNLPTPYPLPLDTAYSPIYNSSDTYSTAAAIGIYSYPHIGIMNGFFDQKNILKADSDDNQD